MAHTLTRSLRLTLLLLAGASMALVPAPGHGRETITAAPRLLADREYYPVLLQEIERAKGSIDLGMYLWKLTDSPRSKPRQLLLALGRANRRGVKVRVVLEESGHDRDLNRTNRATAQLLEKEGIKVCFDSPKVTSHLKLAVIDNRLVFLGSHNLTQAALGHNHELSLLIEDGSLAASLTAYLDKLANR